MSGGYEIAIGVERHQESGFMMKVLAVRPPLRDFEVDSVLNTMNIISASERSKDDGLAPFVEQRGDCTEFTFVDSVQYEDEKFDCRNKQYLSLMRNAVRAVTSQDATIVNKKQIPLRGLESVYQQLAEAA
jgi:hypothetical protein